MIPIYYKSSEGEIVNLIETPYRMLTETDLLNSEWETTTTGENFPRITRLDKKLVSPKFKIRVTGSTKTEMANNLEHLESVFDRDCFLNQMGRLYIGEFYRECFITGIAHGKVFGKAHTVAEYVATSNDGYWVSNKEISFSGSGALVGEIADKMYVSASHRSQDIIYTPDTNHTCHLEWSANIFENQWIRFDLGQVTNIGSFGEINLSSSGVTPISCRAEISNGEVVDDSRSITVDMNEPDVEANPIYIDDFTHITLDSKSYQNCAIYMYGHYDFDLYTSPIRVEIGDTVDVSEYRYITFYVVSTVNDPITIGYTVNEEQWATVETYSGDSTVILEDIECSSIRLRGNYIGTINDDISVVSDEQAPVRNLLDLGYQLENVSEERRQISDEVWVYWSASIPLDCFVYFDDTNVELKSIVTGSAIDVTGTLQGFTNNEWVDIADIEQNMDETYSNHYDRLRIKLLNDSEFDLSNFTIGVITDARVYNESYAPSNAIIEISGMPNNPSVVIGGYEYGADIELSQGHTLVIDTKKKTVRDYADEDTYENVYASRMLESFTPIETGENEVTWGGNANIKITLEQARSIPKWN